MPTVPAFWSSQVTRISTASIAASVTAANAEAVTKRAAGLVMYGLYAVTNTDWLVHYVSSTAPVGSVPETLLVLASPANAAAAPTAIMAAVTTQQPLNYGLAQLIVLSATSILLRFQRVSIP